MFALDFIDAGVEAFSFTFGDAGTTGALCWSTDNSHGLLEEVLR